MVKIGGNTYSVHFQHSTTCVLVPQSVGANLDPLTGRTNCGARDDFDKTTGNKIAFTRAIADLPRDQRQQAWESMLGITSKRRIKKHPKQITQSARPQA